MGNSPLSIRLDGDSAALALIPDSLVDPLSLSVGDRVRVELSLRKVVVHGVANGGSGAMAGDIKWTARDSIPTGWLVCQGQSLLRSEYPTLFDAIGTTYGSADSTHFNVPNVAGKTPVGVSADDADFDAVGKTGGEKTHKLTVAEMPAHNHADAGHAHGQKVTANSGGPAIRTDYTGDSSGQAYAQGITTDTAFASIQNSGGGGSHNNMPPFIAFNCIIKI
jgi:microcystin-dependent protein